jgi:hypothetical protein
MSLTSEYGNDMAQINNALIIGKTSNTDETLEEAFPRGIITPRTDNFLVTGVRFFNFNWNNASAVGSCSHCFHAAATDNGARTIKFSNISIDNATVTRIMNYQFPHKAIFYDIDGTLTGKGAGSWATPHYPSHNWTGCELNETYYGGWFCDSSVEIRRIAFHNAVPASTFRGMRFNVLRYDDDMFIEGGGSINKTEFIANESNYGLFEFREKLDPRNGWAVPFVTGHKYKIHFGVTGLDFTGMQIDLSEEWRATDRDIYLVHNWTDVREAINVTVKHGGDTVNASAFQVENASIAANSADYQCG